MRRRRELSAAERALWERVMQDAAPLYERTAPTVAAEPAPPPREEQPERPVATAPPAARRGAALDPDRPVGLDRRTWLRLRRGQIVVEQTLDLHGQSQERAHERLGAVLAAAQAQGRRCLLVVTGKGEASGGVLRHMVPRWLNEAGNRERIVGFCAAQRRHGGAGALYVLLRRTRRPA
jgi:DNA-nicking Smr family endonuclease